MKSSFDWSHCFKLLRRLFVMLYILGLGAWCLSRAHTEVGGQRAFARDMSKVSLIPPPSVPPLGQASIDAAIVMFGIEIPAGTAYPVYDENLRDRGLTTRGAFLAQSLVAIGPAAFTSWSLLGSTLSHELEVHCRQNFFFISLMDALHLDGTGEAERQAYLHELRNAKRFGLDIPDSELIASTMEYYYPDSVDGRSPAPIASMKRWLARNFLRSNAGI